VHTIRGNAAAFGVRTLRDLGDAIEKLLILGRDGDTPIDEAFKEKLVKMIPELKIGLETHIDETERIFNEIFDPEKSMDRNFQVSNLYLNEFEEIIKKIKEIELRGLLFRKLKEVTFVKIKKFLLQYSDIVQQLSLRQEKKISPLFINGGDVLVDEKPLEPFFTSFVHLVLNCVDHGIETPSERLERGKAEEAIIRIRVQTGDDGLYLSIEDDGRGIDPDALVEKAMQKNMISKNHVAAMSIEDKYKLIFKEGFSTSRRMTSTSGRGIGMSAVKLEVDKLGGSIKISSKIGKGTMFTIYLPVEAY
jgi:two-component system chemotaxis sensor kinase CheA